MRGVRIVTPSAGVYRVPVVKDLFRAAELRLADSPLGYFGGFYVAVIRKG
jgi:hypothetical protein